MRKRTVAHLDDLSMLRIFQSDDRMIGTHTTEQVAADQPPEHW